MGHVRDGREGRDCGAEGEDGYAGEAGRPGGLLGATAERDGDELAGTRAREHHRRAEQGVDEYGVSGEALHRFARAAAGPLLRNEVEGGRLFTGRPRASSRLAAQEMIGLLAAGAGEFADEGE